MIHAQRTTRTGDAAMFSRILQAHSHHCAAAWTLSGAFFCLTFGASTSASAATPATFSMSCASLATVCAPTDHLKIIATVAVAADANPDQKATAVQAAEGILNSSTIEIVDRDSPDRKLNLGEPLRTNTAAERLIDLRPILASRQRAADVRSIIYGKDGSTIALRVQITPKDGGMVSLAFTLDMSSAYKDGTVGLLLADDPPHCETPGSNGRAAACGMGSTLVLPTTNLQQWFSGTGRQTDAVGLQLNEVAMTGMQSFAEAVQVTSGLDTDDRARPDTVAAERRRNELRFKLQRDLADATSLKSWTGLLESQAGRQIDLKVSVGADSKRWTYAKTTPLSLKRSFWLVAGVSLGAIGLLVLAGFLPLWGTAKGTTLRATNVLEQSKLVYDSLSETQKNALREHGMKLTFLPPHSLSRLQMTLWIATVMLGFIVLWCLTQSDHLINSTALALIGISATSMVFAQVIDFPTDADKIIDAALAAVLTTFKSGSSTENEVEPKLIAAREAGLITTNHFARDIFAEKGTTRSDLHRVQLAAFTVFYFVVYVLSLNESLALPEFSTNTLALLGISSASYLGFKIGASK
jgi:hypothetical protein